MANKKVEYPKISRNRPYCKVVYKKEVAPVNGKPSKITITFRTYINKLNNNIMWEFAPYKTMYAGSVNEANNIISNILRNFPDAKFTKLTEETQND